MESSIIWNVFCSVSKSGQYTEENRWSKSVRYSDGCDRVAQMVIKERLEAIIEPCFLSDSYGYRSAKSAIQAIGVTRKRCWEYNWIL